MFRHSAMTGLTLPGMIDDPGCSAGSRSSEMPVRGPDASSRKSLAMRLKSMASARSAPDSMANRAMLCIE